MEGKATTYAKVVGLRRKNSPLKTPKRRFSHLKREAEPTKGVPQNNAQTHTQAAATASTEWIKGL